MEKPLRCRYCGEHPIPYGWGSGAWSYTCNCIFWQSNQTLEYWSSEEAAVRHWNKTSGLGTVEKSEELADIEPMCKCQSMDLLWYGCRCNYAEWVRKNKKT